MIKISQEIAFLRTAIENPAADGRVTGDWRKAAVIAPNSLFAFVTTDASEERKKLAEAYLTPSQVEELNDVHIVQIFNQEGDKSITFEIEFPKGAMTGTPVFPKTKLGKLAEEIYTQAVTYIN